jgi:hypothetical protein
VSAIAPIAHSAGTLKSWKAVIATPTPTAVIRAPVRLSGRRSQAYEPTATKPTASRTPRYGIDRPPGGRRPKSGVAISTAIATATVETQAAAIVTRMTAEPTGHKRGMRIVLATLAALLVIAPPAAEAKSFRGKTSQKRFATVVVGADGLITRIRISYSAPCSDPAYRFPNVLRLEPPFMRSTTDDLKETVKLTDRLSGGGRSRQTATVTARRVVDAAGAESWKGTFKTKAVLTRGGKRIDTCQLKHVTWTATPTS